MADAISPDIRSYSPNIQRKEPIPRPPFIPRTEAQPVLVNPLEQSLPEDVVRAGSSDHAERSSNPLVDLVMKTARSRGVTPTYLSQQAGFEPRRVNALMANKDFTMLTVAKIDLAAQWSDQERFDLIMAFVPDRVKDSFHSQVFSNESPVLSGTIGEQLKGYRLLRGLSIRGLKRITGMSETIFAGGEKGSRPFSLKSFATWTYTLGLNPRQISNLFSQIRESASKAKQGEYSSAETVFNEPGKSLQELLSDLLQTSNLKSISNGSGVDRKTVARMLRGSSPHIADLAKIAKYAGWGEQEAMNIVMTSIPEAMGGFVMPLFPSDAPTLSGTVGEQLRGYRLLRGLSEQELAKRALKYSSAEVWRIEQDRIPARLLNIAPVIAALGLNPTQTLNVFIQEEPPEPTLGIPNNTFAEWASRIIKDTDNTAYSLSKLRRIDRSTLSRLLKVDKGREPSTSTFALFAALFQGSDEEVFQKLTAYVPEALIKKFVNEPLQNFSIVKGSPKVQLLKYMSRSKKSNNRLGEDTGLDKSTISRIRRGERIPELSSFAKLAVAIRLTSKQVREYLRAVAAESSIGSSPNVSTVEDSSEISAIQAETELPVGTPSSVGVPDLERATEAEDEEKPASWMRYDQVTKEVFDHAVEVYTRITGHPPRGKIDYSQLEQLKDLQGKGFLQWGGIGNPLEARRQLGQDKELFVRFSASAFSEKPVYHRREKEFEREMERYMQEKKIAVPAELTRGRHVLNNYSEEESAIPGPLTRTIKPSVDNQSLEDRAA